MSGLLRRLTRRRPATADETQRASEPAAAPAQNAAHAGGGHALPADDQATRVLPATGDQPTPQDAKAAAWVDTTPGAAPATAGERATGATPGDPQASRAAPGRDLPAGVDPGELEAAPVGSARRGRLRRRLRYLRRVRELLLRDLGGFAYELHRTAGGAPREGHRRIAEAKAGRLDALDAEVHELEGRLSAPHAEAVLREPGVGGTCPHCGELHASDAHYCSRCGSPLDARARAERDAALAAAAQPTTGSHATVEPQPASVLWAAGPRPRSQPEGADRTRTTPDPPADAHRDPAAAAPAPAHDETRPVTSGDGRGERPS